MRKFKVQSQLKQIELGVQFTMAKIAISNLHTPGAELFMDSESYFHELTDAELDVTKGGGLFFVGVAVGILISARYC